MEIPMLSMSLDCPFPSDTSVFSNFYLDIFNFDSSICKCFGISFEDSKTVGIDDEHTSLF
jgi:hypothetical protein